MQLFRDTAGRATARERENTIRRPGALGNETFSIEEMTRRPLDVLEVPPLAESAPAPAPNIPSAPHPSRSGALSRTTKLTRITPSLN